MPVCLRRVVAVLIVGVGGLGIISGCTSYVTPGQGADMAAMGAKPGLDEVANDTPFNIDAALARRPAVTFPTAVAVARIQSPGYRSFTAQSYGEGKYSIVTTRDVEDPAQVERLAKLPMLKGLAPVNRLLVPPRLNSDVELRQAAASLQADLLLVYTIDTDFYVRDMATPLTVVSLGLSPNQQARVVTTASAVLMDTRTGYIYGTAEATERDEQLASAWTNSDAVDSVRLRTEKAAFDKLVEELEKTWTGVVATYAGAANAPVTGG